MAGSTPASPSADLALPGDPAFLGLDAAPASKGSHLVSDGTDKPYRCKLRAPGYAHLQAMDFMCRGHMLADVSAVLGSLDLVFGEVAR